MRARNIKPGFFTNDQLAELPVEARLLFIGLTMIADREGRLEDRPKKIKMLVFPADTIEVETLLAGLDHQGLIARYEVDGKRYIEIPKFLDHQRPHHQEKASAIPPRSEEVRTKVRSDSDEGASLSALNPESCSLNAECLPTEEAPTEPSASADPAGLLNGKFQSLESEILAAYHETLPDLPRIRDWNDRRRRKLRARIRERLRAGKDRAATVDYWRDVFGKVAASDFLMGRKTDWQCPGLEWLLEPKNFTKLIEGAYDNRGASNGRS